MSARVVVLLALQGMLAALPAAAQPRATVREFQQTFTTYPFSDPDPIPAPGRIYPYFRFDGYTDTPVQQAWTVVELENEFLKVRVLPQVGGKLWTAIDKATGKPFIYDNGVVKFRDIAMRGPWTSGGIEANYGIMGHTPNCATPVDYVTRHHPDGSASIVIGVLDLLTRTPWRLEIALPADAAYFTTRSLWQNTSPLAQPYYTWMNVGLKAAGGLQFVYPGTHFIGHDGAASPWPIHPQNGRDLSYYDRNDFGPYKSYHVVGRHTDFFGAYWHDEDFGMARYSTREDKPGKKIWIWGLSPQGMIWERLLTDTSGQYVEVQSGRLFNQSNEASTRSPFKHRGFAAGATDTWTEYWFPVKGLGGFAKASDVGAVNVRRDASRLSVSFMAVRRVSGVLQVLDGERLVVERSVVLSPLDTVELLSPEDVPDQRLRVVLRAHGGTALFEHRADPAESVLARPLESPADFDWQSVYGLYLQGKEHLRQRAYGPAADSLRACLARDPHYVPALVDLAALRYRAVDYQGAFDLASRALAVDTYDGAANYHYGLAAEALGRAADARDGFEVATQSIEFRTAAFQRLARLAVRDHRWAEAAAHARRAIEHDANGVEARLLLALAQRLAGDTEGAAITRETVRAIDPLNHTAAFEQVMVEGGSGSEAERAFVGGIRNEMPHQTFLELAAWYFGLGRLVEADRVLALAPESAEVLYWQAFLLQRMSSPWRGALARATATSPALVFPFRPESAEVFAWATTADATWRPKYYLALVHLGLGNAADAARLLEACGSEPDFAPFYAVRAAARRAADASGSLADLERAAVLDPQQWRFGRLLVERHVENGRYPDALAAAARYHARFPRNYVLGMLHARALLLNGRARDAASVLTDLRVLPYEGATEGQRLRRLALLTLAAEALARRDTTTALGLVRDARDWPEHLGAGKPYPADVDESLEDALEWKALAGAGRAPEAAAVADRLASGAERSLDAGALAAALALRDAGRAPEAARALARWEAAEADAAVRAWGRDLFEGRDAATSLRGGARARLRPVELLWTRRP